MTTFTEARSAFVLALAAGVLIAPLGAMAADASRMHEQKPAGMAMNQDQMGSGAAMNRGQMGAGQPRAAGGSHGQPSMMGHMMGTGPMAAAARDMGDGNRVKPVSHLSVDDVRHFFEHRLESQGFSKLKVETAEASDDGAIAVDIVASEGTVVQTFEVDRHTGQFQQTP